MKHEMTQWKYFVPDTPSFFTISGLCGAIQWNFSHKIMLVHLKVPLLLPVVISKWILNTWPDELASKFDVYLTWQYNPSYVGDFLCPWHWFLINFNVIRNYIQKPLCPLPCTDAYRYFRMYFVYLSICYQNFYHLPILFSFSCSSRGKLAK